MVKSLGNTVIASTVKFPVRSKSITNNLFKSKSFKQLFDELLKKELWLLSTKGKFKLLRKSFMKNHLLKYTLLVELLYAS